MPKAYLLSLDDWSDRPKELELCSKVQCDQFIQERAVSSY